MCLCIVAIADCGSCNKEFERVILFQVEGSTLQLLLKLTHPLLSVAMCEGVRVCVSECVRMCKLAG